MPRKSNKQLRGPSAASVNIGAAMGGVRIETKRGKDYEVRTTLDGQSVYKCPGCNMPIPQGSPSVTVIERDHFFGKQAAIDDRRHWHTVCWQRFR